MLSPLLMANLGVRAVSVASGLLGTWFTAVLFARKLGPRRALAPAALGALMIWCNVASGRTTFALGTAIGLGALLAGRRSVIALCSAAATLASPIAGLFLLVVGAAAAIDWNWSRAVPLILPPCATLAAASLLFPFHGEQPMPGERLLMPLAVCVAVVVTAPREWRLPRVGSAVYALGVVLCYLIPSPVGTNVVRLAATFGPPLLLAALTARWAGSNGRRRVVHAFGITFLVLTTMHILNATVRDLRVTATVPSWHGHTDDVVRELRLRGAERTRIEVVPNRDHREAAVLAPHFNLARGWNRQLDVERGRLFYDGTLTPDTYHAWLKLWAVEFVVLNSGTPDSSGREEARIVRSGPTWLRPVWGNGEWTVYHVLDAVPLIDEPAKVLRADEAEIIVHIPAPGSYTLRVVYSPWLSMDGGCVRPIGEWTRLTVPKGGDYKVGSPYRGGRDHGCGTRTSPAIRDSPGPQTLRTGAPTDESTLTPLSATPAGAVDNGGSLDGPPTSPPLRQDAPKHHRDDHPKDLGWWSRVGMTWTLILYVVAGACVTATWAVRALPRKQRDSVDLPAEDG
ncbi:hypothetical protein [Embleya sp. NPDC001921]